MAVLSKTEEGVIVMTKQLNNVQRVQQYLKKIFRLLNEQIFDNELEDVQIVLSNKAKCYGYYTLNGATWVGHADGQEFNQHEIGISAQYLATRDITDVVATLCHECCHHYCFLNGIKDVSRGQYHNSRFRRVAEAHGLSVAYDSRIGHSITSCGERLLQFCIDNDLREIMLNRSADFYVPVGTASRSSGGLMPTMPRKPSSFKLLCSSCGCSVRATKASVRIMCMDCNAEMHIV